MRRRLLAIALVTAGCAGSQLDGTPTPVPPDLTFSFPPGGDMTTPDPPPEPNPCGDFDPSCYVFRIGLPDAPFPLPTDVPPDPAVDSDGLARDKNGYLALYQTHVSYDIGWVANATDWSRGTVSKIVTRDRREVARYLTVACTPCQNGCCSNDDPARFAARLANQAVPDHQPLQLTANLPSRTSVDFNGDLWIENRAPGGQASVTKIANDTGSCFDRNKNGAIDTSSDENQDGLIQTDCNGDGKPDDLASVKGKPCANGMRQEFFGLDDECLLFTANLGPPAAEGRALALGPGAQDFGPSDAWAGTLADTTFYRVDGTTGIIKDRAVLPMECQPDGLAVDSWSIAWSSAASAGPLCWFNTKKPSDHGRVRDPQTGPIDGRAISLDRDQNLWVADRTAARAFRYTPNRKGEFSAGFFTRVVAAGQNGGAAGNGAGIAVDSRNPNSYFAWLALDSGWIVRLPGSKIPLPLADQDFDASNEPAQKLAGFTPIAVGVDRNANLQVIGRAPSASIRVAVDAMGTASAPDLKSPPMQGASCPAGDRCLLKDNQASEPGSDAYTDFTDFGVHGGGRPKGYYRVILPRCQTGYSKWIAIAWDADVPLNTSLTVRARTGPTPLPDNTWGPWTPDFQVSQADLINGMPLAPNGTQEANYLQFEFDLVTMDKNASPHLKSIQVMRECIELAH